MRESVCCPDDFFIDMECHFYGHSSSSGTTVNAHTHTPQKQEASAPAVICLVTGNIVEYTPVYSGDF